MNKGCTEDTGANQKYPELQCAKTARAVLRRDELDRRELAALLLGDELGHLSVDLLQRLQARVGFDGHG